MSAIYNYFSQLLMIVNVLVVDASEWDVVTQKEFREVTVTNNFGDFHRTFQGVDKGSQKSLEILDSLASGSITTTYSEDMLPELRETKAIIQEITKTKVQGDSDWNLLRCWVGEVLTHITDRYFERKPQKAILLVFRNSRNDEVRCFEAIGEFVDKSWKFVHLPSKFALENIKSVMDILTCHQMHENIKSLKAKWDSEVADTKDAVGVQSDAIELLNTERDQLQVERDQIVLIAEQRKQQLVELRVEIDRQKDEIEVNERHSSQETLRLQAEIEDQRQDYEQLQKIIWIVCVSTGGLAFVFGVVFLGLRCLWRNDMRTKDIHQDNPNDQQIISIVPETVIPGILENNRPPILVDECGKFGMNEIYGVTAGEGGNLVRIARPLETAGGARKLSEELLNIQPIFQDEEGRVPSKLHGTSPGGTKGGDTGGEYDIEK